MTIQEGGTVSEPTFEAHDKALAAVYRELKAAREAYEREKARADLWEGIAQQGEFKTRAAEARAEEAQRELRDFKRDADRMLDDAYQGGKRAEARAEEAERRARDATKALHVACKAGRQSEEALTAAEQRASEARALALREAADLVVTLGLQRRSGGFIADRIRALGTNPAGAAAPGPRTSIKLPSSPELDRLSEAVLAQERGDCRCRHSHAEHVVTGSRACCRCTCSEYMGRASAELARCASEAAPLSISSDRDPTGGET